VNRGQIGDPDYDFSDALLPVVSDLFCQIIHDLLDDS
jgi:hypothetical protein